MTGQAKATGLLLPSREVLLWGKGDLAFIVEAARHAEQVGFDSVWVGDSLLARPRGEPLTLLGGVAGATNRVTLGTAVLLPLLRHAISMAQAVATLDRISGGRVILGVGPAADLPGTHAELKAIGVRSDKRVTDMVASLERSRRLWRGEEPDIDMVVRPAQAGGPPIWIGGGGPRMLRLAGGTFEGWIPLSPNAGDYAAGLKAVREAAERAGRDPAGVSTGVYLTVAVADSKAAAASELDQYIRAYYGVPAEVMARAMALHAGTIEDLRELVAGYRAVGARHVVLRLARPDLSDYVATLPELLHAAR